DSAAGGEVTAAQQKRREEQRQALLRRIDAGTDVVQLAVATGKLAYQAAGDQQKVVALAQQLVQTMSKTLDAALAELPPGVAKKAAAGFQAAAAAGPVAYQLLQGNTDAALAELSRGLTAAMDRAAADTGNQKLAIAGNALKAAFEVAAAGVNLKDIDGD